MLSGNYFYKQTYIQTSLYMDTSCYWTKQKMETSANNNLNGKQGCLVFICEP